MYCTHPALRVSRGVSLIELLVSIVIGSILVFGAVTVYVDSKRTYDVNESLARLQETARYAMSVVEPDIRLAGYFGLLKGTGFIQVDEDATLPTTCGADFTRPTESIVGTNASYDLGCDAYGSGAVETSDGITLRRASVTPTSATTGRLFVCTSRISGLIVDDVDDDGCPSDSVSADHNYIVNHYYVARESTQNAQIAALRRYALAAGPAIDHEEIIPGVEDMQIQFGVSDGAVSGTATRYVEPPAAAGSQIVSVRIWLLVRSEAEEVGHIDGRIYLYGSRVDEDSTTDDLNDADSATLGYRPNDGFRRLLVSRTIQLRNAMGT